MVAELQRSELIHTAREKAKTLLEGLQRDQSAVVKAEGGTLAFQAVIDATSTTLDNLNRALEVGSSSNRS